MDALLMVFSVIALVAGFLFLSEATTGVGIIGVGAVLAMFARIAQSSNQQKQLMKELETIRNMLTPQYVERTGGEQPSTGEPEKVSGLNDLRQMVKDGEKTGGHVA